LVTSRENVRYLTGFAGTMGMLLVTPERALFGTDGRYILRSEQEIAGVELQQIKSYLQGLAALLEEVGPDNIGLEAEHLSFAQYEKLAGACRGKGAQPVPTHKLVENQRLIKDQDEVAYIRQAISIAERVFILVERALLSPGIVEQDLASEMEFVARSLGSEGAPFETIVASGERSAYPHGIAHKRTVASGELVLIDFGVNCQGYAADISRTFIVGEPTSAQREIHQVVWEAQRAALAIIKPGVTAKEIDKAARAHITAKGYGPYFLHATGHGVGLEVHEAPKINETSDVVLAPGMVITVEPGVYIPEIGGVRIEDMVLITPEGMEILTDALPRELVWV